MKDEIASILKRVKRRNKPDELRNIIVSLCAVESLQPPELVGLLGKSESRIRQMLTKLVGPTGPLYYAIPNVIHHPRQAYTAHRPEQKPDVLGEGND